MLSVIHIVINKFVVKAFQSTAFELGVKQDKHEFLLGPESH